MRLIVSLAVALAVEFAVFLCLYSRPVGTTAREIILLAPTTQSLYERVYIEQLTRRAADNNVDVIVLDARSDGGRQIRQLEYAVASRPDAVLLMPRRKSGFAGSLQQARRIGVPVGVVDSTLDPEEQALAAFSVGANNYRAGQMAADQLSAALRNTDGRVVLIMGPPRQQSSEARRQGFLDRLQRPAHVVAERQGDWTEEQGYAAMRDLLRAGTEVDGVFALDDTMALGVLRALREAGRDRVAVVSVNGSREAMSLVADGSLHATILQSPAEQADLAFDRAFTRDGPAVVTLPVTVVTRDNVQSNLERGW